MTVAMTRTAIAAFAAIVVGGCGGGEEQERVFTPADGTRIANVRPVMPGWTWPKNPEKRTSSGTQTEAKPTAPVDIELERQLADIVFFADAGNKWRDADKLANLSVQVVASAAEAHEAMAAFNAFSRGWGEGFGRITKDEGVDGLGDEAWRLWTAGQGFQVTYHWRRGNLFLEAHVHCFGSCPADFDAVDAATRAWVDAIDETARAGS